MKYDKNKHYLNNSYQEIDDSHKKINNINTINIIITFPHFINIFIMVIKI